MPQVNSAVGQAPRKRFPAAAGSLMAMTIQTHWATKLGIAIGTHGKPNAGAFWTRSIGARILTRTLRPVLLTAV